MMFALLTLATMTVFSFMISIRLGITMLYVIAMNVLWALTFSAGLIMTMLFGDWDGAGGLKNQIELYGWVKEWSAGDHSIGVYAIGLLWYGLAEFWAVSWNLAVFSSGIIIKLFAIIGLIPMIGLTGAWIHVTAS